MLVLCAWTQGYPLEHGQPLRGCVRRTGTYPLTASLSCQELLSEALPGSKLNFHWLDFVQVLAVAAVSPCVS